MQPPASWTGYGWRIPSYREFESPGGNLQTRPLFSASAVWQHEPIMPIFWVLTILRRAAAPTLLAPPLGTPKEETRPISVLECLGNGAVCGIGKRNRG